MAVAVAVAVTVVLAVAALVRPESIQPKAMELMDRPKNTGQACELLRHSNASVEKAITYGLV